MSGGVYQARWPGPDGQAAMSERYLALAYRSERLAQKRWVEVWFALDELGAAEEIDWDWPAKPTQTDSRVGAGQAHRPASDALLPAPDRHAPGLRAAHASERAA